MWNTVGAISSTAMMGEKNALVVATYAQSDETNPAATTMAVALCKRSERPSVNVENDRISFNFLASTPEITHTPTHRNVHRSRAEADPQHITTKASESDRFSNKRRGVCNTPHDKPYRGPGGRSGYGGLLRSSGLAEAVRDSERCQ